MAQLHGHPIGAHGVKSTAESMPLLWTVVAWWIPTIVVLVLRGAMLVTCVVSSAMVTQYLEHAVLVTIMRRKWQKAKTFEELKATFYQVYWSLLLTYVVASTVWMYVTERHSFRTAYALVFFTVWQLLQLSVTIFLTSWEETIKHLKAKTRHTWLHAALDMFPTLTSSSSA